MARGLTAGGQRPLIPYLPRVAIEWCAEPPGRLWRALDGTLVFADVSGFTALSERLARRGRIGAEELTDLLGGCFARLLALAYADGGSLLKFGGDALLLLFDGVDHAQRGCRAAVRLRRELRQIGRLTTSVGAIRLRMSMGVHSGEIHLFRVGESHRELIITGPTATEVVAMETAAAAGEIVVSLLLDLGTGMASITTRATIKENFRGTALVTHLHYDHVLGLPFFKAVNHPTASLEVFGPLQPEGSLADAFAALVRPPYFPIHLRDLGGDITFHEVSTDRFAVGALQVMARLVPHVGPTLGYRIEYDGKVLSYISDHQAPRDLRGVADAVLELCDGADLLIHDAQYTHSEFLAKPDWGHSTAEYALLVAREANARRLCLFHHDPSHLDDDLDEMLSAVRPPAEAAGIAVLAAAENLAVSV